jgi:hypothetical protein
MASPFPSRRILRWLVGIGGSIPLCAAFPVFAVDHAKISAPGPIRALAQDHIVFDESSPGGPTPLNTPSILRLVH